MKNEIPGTSMATVEIEAAQLYYNFTAAVCKLLLTDGIDAEGFNYWTVELETVRKIPLGTAGYGDVKDLVDRGFGNWLLGDLHLQVNERRRAAEDILVVIRNSSGGILYVIPG